ncbi:MAG: alanine--tRNA ligase [Verrucomicrobiales bacterium]|nr:alanine--tRNA ligase [Verrucomicrobiales bacterium]
MTSQAIRQSFLDFFQEKQHTIVPSASLMPTSPNLLFTNAGMNQFVPYFLGAENAPYDPPRAADTQKCIRAGGKHNDLEDVGYDTYHHTLFEMLGNWSFGDYFKQEAIEWAWELLTERWNLPAERLYATVYKPGEGDPADFDQEAYDIWKKLFEKAGLDPDVHIVNGNKKDNFWMMGDTGPCGPCSELHIDLTPKGDTKGSLVNSDDARCIEIWNLVFIQFNAEPDGSFRPLPACHVDTGMGFERVCSIIQGTKNSTDFSTLVSNYDTDVFTPLFDRLSELSGKSYQRTLPAMGKREGLTEQEQIDVAFRVIADHIRTLSFSIADGILPSNEGRGYVLRRILRRAVRYARNLGLGEDGAKILSSLVQTLVDEFSPIFPELKERQAKIIATLDAEEESFNRTLDRGMKLFADASQRIDDKVFPGDVAFKLYDTYGFPIDLTVLMAEEQGLSVDMPAYEEELQAQVKRSQAGRNSTLVMAVDIDTDLDTKFIGFDTTECDANVLESFENAHGHFIIVDVCPFYAEMGGQVGDSGTVTDGDNEIKVLNTTKAGAAICLQVEELPRSKKVQLKVDTHRRASIEGHHSATHLLHWALHSVVSNDVTQQGSMVAPGRLRFDCNCAALNTEQITQIENLVNEKITAAEDVFWGDRDHIEVKDRKDIMQFFGDKYGDQVRVVQIGGKEGQLDGYSMELCGGTHVRNTQDIGLFKIRSEAAIAAGIRRIEAVCGDAAIEFLDQSLAELKAEHDLIDQKLQLSNQALVKASSEAVAAPELDEAVVASFLVMMDHTPELKQQAIDAYRSRNAVLKTAASDADKKLKKIKSAAQAGQADALINELTAKAVADAGDGTPILIENFADADPGLLQELLNGLKKSHFAGIAVMTLPAGGKVNLAIYVAPTLTDRFQAGKLMGDLAPIIGGRGGGKAEMARGAGNDEGKIAELQLKAKELLAQ